MNNQFLIFQPGQEEQAAAALDKGFAEVAADTPAALEVRQRSAWGQRQSTTAYPVIKGEAYMINCKKDFTAAGRLVIPKFVHALCALLKCTPSQLLVVPVAESAIVVGTLASAQAVALLTNPAKLATLESSDTRFLLSYQPMIPKDVPGAAESVWVEWQPYGPSVPSARVPPDLVQLVTAMLSSVQRSDASANPLQMTPQVLQQLQQVVAARTQGSSRQAPPALPEAPARLPKLCSRCEQACERPKLCSGCGVARYCSAACQSRDWKQHKPGCREWAAGRTKPS
ncbi:hypothetical protein WJX72_008739 [[Myrmecia] bisecta]|uniref:MYND-type domain-containing protein n=1 Tax=[Myrmecia] bisecta TaxID=41462 RepID=A0AAW1Q1X9_9CHLO